MRYRGSIGAVLIRIQQKATAMSVFPFNRVGATHDIHSTRFWARVCAVRCVCLDLIIDVLSLLSGCIDPYPEMGTARAFVAIIELRRAGCMNGDEVVIMTEGPDRLPCVVCVYCGYRRNDVRGDVLGSV